MVWLELRHPTKKETEKYNNDKVDIHLAPTTVRCIVFSML